MLCHFLNIFARSNILIPLTFTKKSHIYQTTADRKLQNPLKSTLCTCERWNKPHTNKGPPNTPPSTLQLCHTLPLPLSMRTIVTTTTTLSTIILTSVLIIGKSCWQIVERGVGVERNKTHPCNSFFSSCDHLSFVSLQWCIQSKTTATKKKMDWCRIGRINSRNFTAFTILLFLTLVFLGLPAVQQYDARRGFFDKRKRRTCFDEIFKTKPCSNTYNQPKSYSKLLDCGGTNIKIEQRKWTKIMEKKKLTMFSSFFLPLPSFFCPHPIAACRIRVAKDERLLAHWWAWLYFTV